jgi:hypothetical protein
MSDQEKESPYNPPKGGGKGGGKGGKGGKGIAA